MAKAPSSGPQYQRALAAYLQAVEADEGFARLTRKAQAQQLDVPLRTMERVWKDIKAKPVADDPERLPGVLSVYWMRGAKAYQLRGDISQHRAYLRDFPASAERARLEAQIIQLTAALATREMLDAALNAPNVGWNGPINPGS